jgi:hypothetical protein
MLYRKIKQYTLEDAILVVYEEIKTGYQNTVPLWVWNKMKNK